jgi:predicted metalloprotease with PDZ domain
MKKSLALLTALLFTVPASRGDDSLGNSKPTITVPFVLLPTGHFLVSVKFGDSGPFNFIFDTGAPTVLIDNFVAKEANLLKGVAKPLFAPFGSMGNVNVKSMEIGDAKVDKVAAIVMDHPTVAALSKFVEKKHGKLHGIVGYPFFAQFKMAVDYQAQKLTLTPNGYQPEDVMQAMMNGIMKASNDSGKPKIVGPTGLWGFMVNPTNDGKAGVLVESIQPDGPAAKAGLKKGDRILTIDGRWTDSPAETAQAMSLLKTVRPVLVQIDRNGESKTIEITPISGL